MREQSLTPWKDGDYPTEAALKRIENCPYVEIEACFDFVREIWHWEDWAGETLSAAEREVVHAEPGDRFLRLATGGWSGNEDIVAALRRNITIGSFCWQLKARGGLHIFKYPPPRVSRAGAPQE